jgi:RimJ/RimL family protein N-acetyltransferase
MREFRFSDEDSLFELDSDPEVHRYLGENTETNREKIREDIKYVRKQYLENGIGRWIIIERKNDEIIGWGGLKFVTEMENDHVNYYDLGYRFMPRYWGKGFATEAALASRDYVFVNLGITELYASIHEDNAASRRVLEKCGLWFVEKYKWRHVPCEFYKMNKEEWLLT